MNEHNGQLFYPGLYQNEEEIFLFNVEIGSLTIKDLNFQTYLFKMEEKLLKLLEVEFQGILYQNYESDDVYSLLFHNGSLSPHEIFNDEFHEFHSSISIILEDHWQLSSNEWSWMENQSPAALASQLVEVGNFKGLLYDFFERIKIINSEESLHNYYVENEILDEEDSLSENTIQEFDNDLINTELSFEEYSSYLFEKLSW